MNPLSATSTSLASTPPFPAKPMKASEKIAQLLEAEHVTPGEMTRVFLSHLAKIEEIEARLGREDLDKGEIEALVKLCHQILNEVQELHLTNYLENVYVQHKVCV